ncbi:MAG: D-tyrosyl-tRNA(Tyr) deacylase [Lachnospiraceae bacterium]|nr:D-tyrosyl-tRNA(Tyr) deacylase [Lachnospiraceae bacterium]
MRFVIQRVNNASVDIDNETVGSIDKGFLVLVGISGTDTRQIADKMVKKLIGMRIFDDENDKINLDLKAVNGNLLLVSQFTLYADCKHGNRPGFTDAGAPDMASEMFDYIVSEVRKEFPDAATGRFGADMKVSLLNDGPFTIILDSDNIM